MSNFRKFGRFPLALANLLAIFSLLIGGEKAQMKSVGTSMESDLIHKSSVIASAPLKHFGAATEMSDSDSAHRKSAADDSAESPPPASSFPQVKQIENVILALIRTGIFSSMAKAIKELDLNMLPQNATFFVPSDRSIQGSKIMENTTILEYHVATQQLNFGQLLSLKLGDRLPTVLSGLYILLTSVQPENYTVDNVKLFWPDLYRDPTLVVHGIDGVLNISAYGAATNGKSSSSASIPSVQPSAAPSSNSFRVPSSPRPRPLPKERSPRPTPALPGSPASAPIASLPLPPIGSLSNASQPSPRISSPRPVRPTAPPSTVHRGPHKAVPATTVPRPPSGFPGAPIVQERFPPSAKNSSGEPLLSMPDSPRSEHQFSVGVSVASARMLAIACILFAVLRIFNGL